MTITEVASATFLADTIIFLRDDLIGSITDPVSGSRAGNEKFVMTSWPRRTTRYPLITIIDRGITDSQPGGIGSQTVIAVMSIEMRVWATNVAQRDEITQAIIQRLRTIQYSSGGTNAAKLFDFTIASMVNVDEPGENGLRNKILTIDYTVVLNSS